MFDETKEIIKNKLKSVIYIALTTDAWTSITQTSYITVTAHFLDEDFKLQNYVLDTSEITSHTSEHLLEHIQGVMRDYGLIDHNVTLNFNATKENYIFEQDKQFEDHEENYLSSEIGESPVEKRKDISEQNTETVADDDVTVI